MYSNGEVIGDGTWDLTVLITDLDVPKQFRVQGDMHVGGLMLRIVEELDVTRDWSDHAIWWPEKNRWLLLTRASLDQCGISADAELHFTPMHKIARIQLPDLKIRELRVDFSVPVFRTVIQMGKDLGIRYPEELSLKKYIDPSTMKKYPELEPETSGKNSDKKSRRTSLPANAKKSNKLPRDVKSVSNLQNGDSLLTPATPDSLDGSQSSNGLGDASFNSSSLHNISLPYPANLNGSSSAHQKAPTSPTSQHSLLSWGDGIPHSPEFDSDLLATPRIPVKKAFGMMLRPKNYIQKAMLNQNWLDSSASLYEQGVGEEDLLQLRFKFMTFFDLNSRYDPVRINQLYEQAKWAILAEELDCTEEEMLMFAALQLQVQVSSSLEATKKASSANGNHHSSSPGGMPGDDVSMALDDLVNALEGSRLDQPGGVLGMGAGRGVGDLTTVPELADLLKYLKPKRFTLKAWKECYFTFRDLHLSYYRSQVDCQQGAVLGKILLKGCEVTPDVNLSHGRFAIKLLVPSAEGMTEFWLKCNSEQQYAKWMAACKLASKGKTMADASYPVEVESLKRLLDMQHPAESSGIPSTADIPAEVDPDELVAAKFLKKWKSRSATSHRILEAHAKVKDLSLLDAKLQFIRAWQSLPEYGIHYFVVKLKGSKKEDLLGIAYNRLMKMKLDSGDSEKTWRFHTMNKWHVNWEIKNVFIQFEEADVVFRPLSCDCKIPHEFIGGYIFLSMRSKDHNQQIDEDLFHKLTGGRELAPLLIGKHIDGTVLQTKA